MFLKRNKWRQKQLDSWIRNATFNTEALATTRPEQRLPETPGSQAVSAAAGGLQACISGRDTPPRLGQSRVRRRGSGEDGGGAGAGGGVSEVGEALG